MFDQPKRTAFTPPPPNLDIEQRYIFKLVKLVDEGVSPFADPAKNETFHQIRWEFNVAFLDSRQPLYGEDGQPWLFTDTSTSKTGKNPKNGMVAKSRLWIEAFLGHSVEQDEINSDTPNQLLNKYATGLFELADRESADRTKYQRLQIMRLSPYKAAVAAPAPPPPPPPPPPQPEQVPF